MKRLVILAVTIVMILALSGCQKTDSSISLQALTSDQDEYSQLRNFAGAEILGACKFTQPEKKVGMKIYRLVYKDGEIVDEEELLLRPLIEDPAGYIAVLPDSDIEGAFEVQYVTSDMHEGRSSTQLEYEWFGEESVTSLDPIGQYETVEKDVYYPIYGLLSGDAPKDKYDSATDLIQHTKVANVVAVKFE